MTAAPEIVEVDAQYPEDLRGALANVYATARKYSDSEVHALRAALNIALQYVTIPDPEAPEMVVMWAESPVEYAAIRWGSRDGVWGHHEVTLTVEAGEFYLACPHCCEVSNPTVAEDGTQYRHTYWDDLEWKERRGLVYGIGDQDDFSCDATFLVCDVCTCRSVPPEWLDAEYT